MRNKTGTCVCPKVRKYYILRTGFETVENIYKQQNSVLIKITNYKRNKRNESSFILYNLSLHTFVKTENITLAFNND